jgi:hypothetical protein
MIQRQHIPKSFNTELDSQSHQNIVSLEHGYGKLRPGEDGLASRGLLYEIWPG